MNKADVPAQASAPVRRFGRFELRQPLGKSLASNSWLAFDANLQAEVLLCVPRAKPSDVAGRDAWTQDTLKASRLKHPRLAEVLDMGLHDGWPYVAYDRDGAQTLSERLASGQAHATVIEQVNWMVEMLEALAYAHEAGMAHRDLALHNVMVDAAGHIRLAGLGVGLSAAQGAEHSSAARQEQRAAAERDVLMAGLMLHRLLAGHPALDDADLGSAASRVGLEIVRLPWTTPQPVPETLRAIVNRATDRQQRQRYLNARTLISALQGWVLANSQESAGPLALFLDRINAVGHLPSRAKDLGAINKLLLNEQLKIDDLVDQIIKDPALSWELLRVINTARFQNSGEEPSCSLSRAVVLLGQQGLRKVSTSVRTWPGVLGAAESRQGEGAGQQAIAALDEEMKMACIAAMAARWLRPFNIGDEDAMVAAMSQHLGRLLILYHYPEESAQIARLMAPVPASEPGGKPTPGMTQEAATGAVLGIHPDDLTAAVLRHWGFSEPLIQAARPLSLNVAPRRPESPEDWLRITASLANELCALIGKPAAQQARMMTHLLSRYARPAVTSQRELLDALQRAIRPIDRTLYRQMFPAPSPSGPGPGAARAAVS
ncbi:MAG TPA: HDOD domain-containing protein [Aquabacterium sp.]|uniref:HDOD domain-containing protein n=1 Tax=Aquabacterium sp. TaxID=1872578 RepID=UPI002E365818|nr:HDOD domain-containing protein [Aquabacterium sp.]HEX5371875.1 HDOD domain-containing protein [Aquabacterium sp.]